MSIKNHINLVNNGNIDIEEFTKESLEKLKKLNDNYTFMSVITEDLALEQARQINKQIEEGKQFPLAGLYMTIKDCICIKSIETTSSSKILKDYKPTFDATIIKRLKDAGAIILGKTIQDEFGFGSFSVNTGIDVPIPKNPLDKESSAGGSSGGCGVATALLEKEGIPHLSIAESTGGSIESPASFCGVLGLCPTYGKVSRYGLISYANSLDKIGVMGNNTKDIIQVFEKISGKDEKDSTSKNEFGFHMDEKELENLDKVKNLKIGILKEGFSEKIKPEIKETINSKIEELKSFGIETEEISLPFLEEYGLSAYYIIAMSEASTNLSCLTGLRYGQQDIKPNEYFSDYFKRIRSENFGKEAKRRIMLGTFTRMAGYRDAYYIKAAKARVKIIKEYKKLFEKYDLILSPTMPFFPQKFNNIQKLKPIDHYMADLLTVGPNLAGMPHLSYPVFKEKKPTGLMMTADHDNEDKIFMLSNLLDKLKEDRK